MLHRKDIVLSLTMLQSRILKNVDQHLSLHGISFSEFQIMHHLYNSANMTMRRIDLAEKIGLSASGVTRLVNPMVKNRLVKKELNPRDARVSLVQLSSSGAEHYNNALVSFEESAEAILKPLNTKQLASLQKLTAMLL